MSCHRFSGDCRTNGIHRHFRKERCKFSEGNGAVVVKIGVYEENPQQREQLCRWIGQVCALYGMEAELAAYSRESTLKEAVSVCRFDVLFLSTDGPEGFLLTRRIRETVPGLRLIFLTDTGRYAVMGVRLHLTDYVVKPVECKHVVRALKLAGVGNGR